MPAEKDLKALRSVYLKMGKVQEGKVLITGSKLFAGSHDRRPWYSGAQVLGIDFQEGAGVDLVHDLQKRAPRHLRGIFDHVDCCSVFEHVENPFQAAEYLVEYLKPRGTLLLSVPFVWRVHGYPSDYWRYTLEGVKSVFSAIDFKHLAYYDSEGREVPKPLAYRDGDDRPMIERSEVMGWGRRK